MKIGVDKAQQDGKHDLKHNQLMEMGHELYNMPVPVGDYIEITPEIQEVIDRRSGKLKKMDTIGLIRVSIDTKRDMEELYSCLVQDHGRFSDSCFLAMNNGIKLIILTENTEGITNSNEIGKWKNEKRWKSWFAAKAKAQRAGKKPPRSPAKPSQLIKTMWTMHQKYDVDFLFCHPSKTAQAIVDLLEMYGGGESNS